MTSDPLKPRLQLLIKLGSIAVHADEMNDYNFNQKENAWLFDLGAIRSLLNDSEVKEWIVQMNKQAFLPVKR